MLIFFIAGLLYLLCFEHVDNLGAYSIPSETGLLIPSVYNRELFASPITQSELGRQRGYFISDEGLALYH